MNDAEVRKSICTICDPQTQCGLDLHLREGRVVKVEGSLEHPHSGGVLCAKGNATRQYIYHEDRLKTPMKQVGGRGSGKFEPISWDEALSTIAEKLLAVKAESGPESVAFYAGYPKWMRPFLHRLAQGFGSPNYCSESSTCATAMIMAWKLVFGAPGSPDIGNTDCLLVWSANPFHANTTMARKLVAAEKRGVKLIVVDPRVSPTAARAHIHLAPRPGTDGALALAMAHVILEEKLFDRDFVDNQTSGFEAYREEVRKFTPEEGERITGVPAEKIREAARAYASAESAALLPSAAPVVQNTNGVQNYRAVFSLIALTGNYDRKGGNLVLPPSYLYTPAGFRTREAEYLKVRPFEQMAPRVGIDRFPVWGELTEQAQAMHLPFQVHSEEPYPVKALLGFGLNHRMWPDPEFFAAALEKLDFVATVDLFMTDSASYADIVLPACSSIERSELRCYPEEFVTLSRPAIEPLFDSRSDVDIIFDLAGRLGLEDPLFSAGYEATLDWILEPSGLTVEELKKHPGGMKVPAPIPVPERKYLKGGFPTPSGKAEFASNILGKYSESHGYDPLPSFSFPKQSKEATPELAEEYPFILNTGSRLPMFVHSRTFRLPWTNSLRTEAAADINPADAKAIGIAQGAPIRLSTPKGGIKVKANLTEMVQPGVVHMYHAYPDADVNTLIEPDYLDHISGFPGYKALLCSIDAEEE